MTAILNISFSDFRLKIRVDIQSWNHFNLSAEILSNDTHITMSAHAWNRTLETSHRHMRHPSVRSTSLQSVSLSPNPS